MAECGKIWISVIGTAGGAKRCPDIKTLDAGAFSRMIARVDEEIIRIVGNRRIADVELVSGGAAWADHVAVMLFLGGKYGALTLHFPCDWDSKNMTFVTNKAGRGAAKIANDLHREFAATLGRDTRKDIQDALVFGAKMIIHDGFIARNNFVAKSDHVIALSWSNSGGPPHGTGTFDTWTKAANKNRVHISMYSFN